MKFDPSSPQYRSVPSRYQAAFKEPANMVTLAAAAAMSFALLNPIPFLIAGVAEVAYLLFVPDTAWFSQRLESKFDAEVVAHREELKGKIYPKVRPEIKDKFTWLEDARTQIEAGTSVQDKWFKEALRKLDFLMEKYLMFADREADFINYLFSLVRESYSSFSEDEIRHLPRIPDSGNQRQPSTFGLTQKDLQGMIDIIAAHYDKEHKNLQDTIEKEQVMATTEILTKRLEVLVRRKEFVGRLSDMMLNLRHQMELIAETFGLINDEIRARSPEQVLADIDDVVIQATSLTNALDSVTPVDQVVAKM